jgi:hypothetical protein
MCQDSLATRWGASIASTNISQIFSEKLCFLEDYIVCGGASPPSIPLYLCLHLTHLHLDAPWRVVREVRRLLAMATLDNIPDTTVLEAKLELESLATILQLDSPTRVHPLIDQATEFKQNLTADSSIYTISFSTTNQSDVDSAYTEYEPREDTESLPMGIRWGLAEIILEDDVRMDVVCITPDTVAWLRRVCRWGLDGA